MHDSKRYNEDVLPDNVMMDMCTENEANMTNSNTFWTTKLPFKKRGFFFVDRSSWRKLKEQQHGNSFPRSWIHTFVKGLKAVHPYCSFQFKRHYVTSKSGRQHSKHAFRADGYCSFSDCTVKFRLIMKSESDLKVNVSFTGKVKHRKNERRARFVRHTQREALGNLLKYKKTRREHLDNLKSLDDQKFMSGCRDEAPRKEVLHKISSESKKLTDSHENEIQALLDIVHKQSDSSKRFSGVLRQVCLSPSYVMLFSLDSVKVYHHISSRDFVYLDATGSVIRNNSTFAESKKYQLYDLVIRHPIKGSPPFVLASLLTTEHNAILICYFVQCFLYAEQGIYGHQGVKPPLMVMTDGSATLMLASLRAFNCECVPDYFNRCYRIVTGAAKPDDFKKALVHCCASHFMKNAAKICRKYYSSNFRDAMYWLGLLLQSSNLTDIDETVESLTVVTHSEFTTGLVKLHYQKLKRQVERLENDIIDSDYCRYEEFEDDSKEFHESTAFRQESEPDNVDMSQDEYIKKSPGSPFKLHLQNVAEQAIRRVNKQNMFIKGSSIFTRNAYLGKHFMNYLLEYCLPNISNWSALLTHDLGRHGDSEVHRKYSEMYNGLKKSKFQNISSDNRTQGIVEKSMQEVKRTKLVYSRCRTVTDFVKMYERDMLPLQREFCEAFCSSKRKTLPKTVKLATETWAKRVRTSTPTGKGVYLTPPTEGLHFKEKPPKKRQTKFARHRSDSEKMEDMNIPPTKKPKCAVSEAESKGRAIDTSCQRNEYLQRGICNDRVSCWWIATVQAMKPFIISSNLNVSKFEGSDVFLWRRFMKLFETLQLETSNPVPFGTVQPLITECELQMNLGCHQQQDAAEFYSQMMVPFLEGSCLTNEIEIAKNVICHNCNGSALVENSTSGILPLAVRDKSIEKCLQACFDEEIVRGSDCDLCGLKKCKKMILSRIVNCPSLLVVQLLRFRAVRERQEKVATEVIPNVLLDLSNFCLNRTPSVYTFP